MNKLISTTILPKAITFSVKNLFLTFVTILSYTEVIAQTKIEVSAFDYYYIFNDRLFDIRSNTPIFPNINFKGDLYYNTAEKSLSHIHSRIQKYDNSGKLINTLEDYIMTLSVDLKTAVYSKDGDVWRAKIDPTTGKLGQGTKVTQLGIFRDYTPVINWYENNLLILLPDGYIYSLNLDNGQLNNLAINCRMLRVREQDIYPNAYHNWWSPTKRYVTLLNNSNSILDPKLKPNLKDLVIDMKTMSIKPFESQVTVISDNIDANSMLYWLADSIALVYSGNNLYDKGRKFYWLNLNNMAVRLAFHIPSNFSDVMGSVLQDQKIAGISKSLSPNYSYLLLPQDQVSGSNMYWFAIHDLKKGSFSKTDVPLSDYYLFGTPNYYEWVSDSSFLFRMAGDITTQGTWLYNVKKNERKKITPYLLDKAIVLPKAGKFIFIANQILYSANIDGSELKQISSEKSPQFLLREFNPGIKPRQIPNFISQQFTAAGIPQQFSIPVGKFIFISGKSNPNLRINVENGLSASVRKDGDWSAHWTLKQVPNTNYYWIENRWKSGERLHVEEPSIKSEKIKDDSWSAHWEFIQVGDSYIIQNRWRQAHKIYLENGILKCATIGNNTPSALWKLQTAN